MDKTFYHVIQVAPGTKIGANPYFATLEDAKRQAALNIEHNLRVKYNYDQVILKAVAKAVVPVPAIEVVELKD